MPAMNTRTLREGEVRAWVLCFEVRDPEQLAEIRRLVEEMLAAESARHGFKP